MSSNAEFEALAREMLALSQTSAPGADAPHAADAPGRSGVLVARLLPDFNAERWRHFCRDHARGRWYVWPAGPDAPSDLGRMDACGGSPQVDNALVEGILLEQIRTLDKSRLREKMGRLDDGTMTRVDNAIAVSFGLE